MRQSELERQITDQYFEGQATRLSMPLFLMLAPPGVFAGLTYYETGYLSPLATTCALAAYSLVFALGAWTVRREVRLNQQRLGSADSP